MVHANDRAEDRPDHEPQAGDTVVALDGVLGRVDRVIRSEGSAPVYLVVAAGRRLRRRYPIVPSSLVTRIDRTRGRVHVRGQLQTLDQLSEQLPIVV